MCLRSRFKVLFPAPPTEKQVNRRQEESRHRLAVLYGSGNVSLQNGYFMTADDIAKRRAKIIRHQF